jgi:hypothetical protein
VEDKILLLIKVNVVFICFNWLLVFVEACFHEFLFLDYVKKNETVFMIFRICFKTRGNKSYKMFCYGGFREGSGQL